MIAIGLNKTGGVYGMDFAAVRSSADYHILTSVRRSRLIGVNIVSVPILVVTESECFAVVFVD